LQQPGDTQGARGWTPLRPQPSVHTLTDASGLGVVPVRLPFMLQPSTPAQRLQAQVGWCA
jgi:hypothetical protein